MKEETINDYAQFLLLLTSKINAHFERQKEYLHCKEGCSMCCEQGEYPCSELEYEFLKIGMTLLDEATLKEIEENVAKIKEEKANFKGKNFSYKCPFLINKRCSIYNFRMIICRTFGIPFYMEEDNILVLKIPFCVHHGLNYSEVYDPVEKTFSQQMYEKTGYKNPPLASNFSLSFIINKLGKEAMKLDFGEEKSLIDWM